MKNILIVIATFGFCVNIAFAQSALDIETKYGKPADVYSVSERVWMTPTYDAEGQVCLMRFYAKRVSPTTNYLDGSLPMDEVLKVIDDLIPVSSRGARKGFFGGGETGGGVAWSRFNYEYVTFTFVSSFRLEKIPDKREPFEFKFDPVDEQTLAEWERKEALRPDSELMRERTAKPQVLEIRWANRKCGAR